VRGSDRLRLVVGAAVFAAGSIAIGGATGSSHVAFAAAGDQVLSLQTVPPAYGATLVGNLSAQTPMSVDVSIDINRPAKEAAVKAVYTPGSPTYHQYFTPAVWAQQFSVPDATFTNALSELTAHGLQAHYVSPEHDLIGLAGTAAQVNQTFGVTEVQYRFANSGPMYFANDRAPTVPAGVDGVAGLTNIGVAARGARQQANCTSPPTGTVCTGGLEYTELTSVYDLGTSYTGAGQRFAEIGDGDVLGPQADLRKYEAERGLPQVPVAWKDAANLDHDCFPAEDANCDTGGEGEWALDVESGSSMAPNLAEMDFYFSDVSFLDNGNGISAWANDANGPLQGSMSEGECETYGTTNSTLNIAVADGTDATFTPGFMQLAGEGRTQFVSSGDNGGSCDFTLVGVNGVTNELAPEASWPASSPWVTAVGGTVLYTDNTGHRANFNASPGELAWTHTGGAPSKVWPEPSWQTQIGTINTPCVVDENEQPVTSPTPCRGVPDVTALSGDITVVAPNNTGNGFDDVEGGAPTGCGTGGAQPCAGSDTEDGGTSLSSPLWAGIWGRINSASPNGAGWGFAPVALYAIGNDPAKDVSDFYDVTVGSNGDFTAIARNPADPTGWDYVSGLGAPDGAHIIDSLRTSTGPQSAVPEAPTTPLLILPLLVGGATLALRRRRAAR